MYEPSRFPRLVQPPWAQLLASRPHGAGCQAAGVMLSAAARINSADSSLTGCLELGFRAEGTGADGSSRTQSRAR